MDLHPLISLIAAFAVGYALPSVTNLTRRGHTLTILALSLGPMGLPLLVGTGKQSLPESLHFSLTSCYPFYRSHLAGNE